LFLLFRHFLAGQDWLSRVNVDQPQHVTFRLQAEPQLLARQTTIGSGGQRLIFPGPQKPRSGGFT
jgi:hypothetical protein